MVAYTGTNVYKALDNSLILLLQIPTSVSFNRYGKLTHVLKIKTDII